MKLEASVPIHDKNLEEDVIGAISFLPAAQLFAFNSLNIDCFYTDHCQRYFRALKAIYEANETIDSISLVEWLKKSGELKEDDVITIMRLSSSASIVGFETHMRILLEYYMKREISKVAVEILTKGEDYTQDAFELINTASLAITKVQENITKGKEVDIAQIAQEAYEQIMRTADEGISGLDTSIIALNKKILGWVAPDLIIIAARPGMGKSALAFSSAKYLAVDQNIPVAIFSLEMNAVQIMQRMYSIDTGIPFEKIKEGRLSDDEQDLLLESKVRFSNSKLHIDDKGGISLNYLRTKAALWKKKYGIQAIFLDYLQLMRGDDERGKNRESIVSDISRGLKALSKELGIPIIALSQLSRAVESRDTKMPQLSDLRESGAIEQDADIVIFLMRPAYYGIMEVEVGGETMPSHGLVIADTAKNRHGSTGKFKMRFVEQLMKYTNYNDEYQTNLRPIDTSNYQSDNPF